MMMQAANFRKFPDRSHLRWLSYSRLRCIHLQRSVSSPVMIIVHVGLQNASQMPLIQYDHVIERVSTDTADNSLAVGILPWTAWRNLHFFEAHVLDSLL